MISIVILLIVCFQQENETLNEKTLLARRDVNESHVSVSSANIPVLLLQIFKHITEPGSLAS
jgi:hypothetical protein